MFPDYNESCIVDIQINGSFRCYQDDSFPLYSINGSDTICEYVLTGIEDKVHNEESIKICPNPATDYIFIESSEPNWKNSIISMYSLEGQKLLEINQPHESKIMLDLQKYTPGLYVIRIANKNVQYIYKRLMIN